MPHCITEGLTQLYAHFLISTYFLGETSMTIKKTVYAPFTRSYLLIPSFFKCQISAKIANYSKIRQESFV